MNDNDPITSSENNGTTRKLRRLFFKGAITVLLLYILLSRFDFQSITKILYINTKPIILLGALGVFLARNLFAGLRWRALLKSKGYNPTPLRLSRYYLIGSFFGIFLPSTIGGDIARGYYLFLDGVRRRETVSSVVIERIFGITVMLTFSLISLLLDYEFIESTSIKLIVILPAITTIVGLIFFYSFPIPNFKLNFKISLFVRVAEWIKRFTQNLHSYRESVRAICSAFLFSALYHLSGVLTYYLIGRSLGDETGFLVYLTLFSPIFLITLFPISLNGLGLRESSFVFFFSLAGMDREIAILVSFLFLSISIIQAALGGIFYLFDPRDIKSIKKYSVDQKLQ